MPTARMCERTKLYMNGQAIFLHSLSPPPLPVACCTDPGGIHVMLSHSSDINGFENEIGEILDGCGISWWKEAASTTV